MSKRSKNGVDVAVDGNVESGADAGSKPEYASIRVTKKFARVANLAAIASGRSVSDLLEEVSIDKLLDALKQNVGEILNP